MQSLSETLDLLAAEQGGDVTNYQLPVATRPFSNVNFLGIPQAGSDELMIAPIEQNRGTENNMMLMKENGNCRVGSDATRAECIRQSCW